MQTRKKVKIERERDRIKPKYNTGWGPCTSVIIQYGKTVLRLHKSSTARHSDSSQLREATVATSIELLRLTPHCDERKASTHERDRT